MKSVAVLNCAGGNIRSVLNAFSIIGTNPFLAKNKNDLELAELIVLPGVGSFNSAIEMLKTLEIIESIKSNILEKE